MLRQSLTTCIGLLFIKFKTKRTMKMYFMKNSGEEVKFGDMIELDFTKDTEDGHTCHHHLECKFIPGLIPLLLEKDIIEEKELKEDEKENTETPDNEDCEIAQIILSTLENFALKFKQMDDKINTLNKIVNKLKDNKNGKSSARE